MHAETEGHALALQYSSIQAAYKQASYAFLWWGVRSAPDPSETAEELPNKRVATPRTGVIQIDFIALLLAGPKPLAGATMRHQTIFGDAAISSPQA